jgi:hypothetical protein
LLDELAKVLGWSCMPSPRGLAECRAWRAYLDPVAVFDVLGWPSRWWTARAFWRLWLPSAGNWCGRNQRADADSGELTDVECHATTENNRSTLYGARISQWRP